MVHHMIRRKKKRTKFRYGKFDVMISLKKYIFLNKNFLIHTYKFIIKFKKT